MVAFPLRLWICLCTGRLLVEPPWHGECSEGLWTTALELRVLQYWIRGHNSDAWGGDWKRDARLEGDLATRASLKTP